MKNTGIFFDSISLLKTREQHMQYILNRPSMLAVPGEHDYAPRGFVWVVNRAVWNRIYRSALAPIQ